MGAMKTLLSKTSAHSLLHHVVTLAAKRLLLVAATLLGRLEAAERFAAPVELLITVALLVAVELAAHRASHAFRTHRSHASA